MADVNGYQTDSDALLRENVALNQSVEFFQERLAALELALEDEGWLRMTMRADEEFSREGLRQIVELCRLNYLKNPLVQRGVNVKRFYVWGQGMSVSTPTKEVNQVLQAFMDDHKNQVELTSHDARMQKEVEIETDGNIFFAFFTNTQTGRVRLRSIPFEQIEDKICNPNDAKEPWYYKRSWQQQKFSAATGTVIGATVTRYYPDWRYRPAASERPQIIGGHAVEWNTPVYHVKTGGFSNWKFGCPEIYASIDWGRAYKEFLEDWSSIVKSYRRFAWEVKGGNDKRGIAAAKAKLSSSLPGGVDSNPPPLTGSAFVSGDGNSLRPVSGGPAVGAEDGRRLLLMVAAVFGLPETFYGDASVGTLATAQSLDRPTELMMRDRQTFWADTHKQIFDYVLLWAVKAPRGALAGWGKVEREIDDGNEAERVIWNDDVDGKVDIDFAPLIAENVQTRVSALVSAATLDGKSLAHTLDLQTLTRMLLVALGEDDVDEMLGLLFPEGWEDDPEHPANKGKPVAPVMAMDGERPTAEAMMVEAVRELRDKLARLQS